MKRENLILFSGGADGAEAEFGANAERLGIEEVNVSLNRRRRRGGKQGAGRRSKAQQRLTAGEGISHGYCYSRWLIPAILPPTRTEHPALDHAE